MHEAIQDLPPHRTFTVRVGSEIHVIDLIERCGAASSGNPWTPLSDFVITNGYPLLDDDGEWTGFALEVKAIRKKTTAA